MASVFKVCFFSKKQQKLPLPDLLAMGWGLLETKKTKKT
jgi:hypothetical protein